MLSFVCPTEVELNETFEKMRSMSSSNGVSLKEILQGLWRFPRREIHAVLVIGFLFCSRLDLADEITQQILHGLYSEYSKRFLLLQVRDINSRKRWREDEDTRRVRRRGRGLR